jgi:hypothetical protein
MFQVVWPAVTDRTKAFIELMLTAHDQDVALAVARMSADPEMQEIVRSLAAMSRSFLQVSLRHIPEVLMVSVRDDIVGRILEDVEDFEDATSGHDTDVEVAPRPPFPGESEGSDRTLRLLAVIS